MRKPQSIAGYIDAAPENSRGHLHAVLACLRRAAPGADEAIKWGIPALTYNRILFQFAGFRHHVGFYPTPKVISAFEEKLIDYKTAKSSIQFPLDWPLPSALIQDIAAFRVWDCVENDARWM